MTTELDFLKFLAADAFGRETMDPSLKSIYESLENKLEVAFVASGGISVSSERMKEIVNSIPHAKEARAAYLAALESYEE